MAFVATASGLLDGCRRRYRGDVRAKRCWHTGIEMLPRAAWYSSKALCRLRKWFWRWLYYYTAVRTRVSTFKVEHGSGVNFVPVAALVRTPCAVFVVLTGLRNMVLVLFR